MAHAKRQVDLAAISSLAPVAALLPTWAIAIAIFWLPFWKFTDVSFPLFAFAALSLGIILFSKSIQKLFLARLLGARQPTYEESVALYQAWRRVAKANHISTSSFLLAVVDSNELNAFASGGHLLVVSSFAVNELDNNELTGVLAHEQSHNGLVCQFCYSLELVSFCKLLLKQFQTHLVLDFQSLSFSAFLPQPH